jgi:hypothetical protein
MVMIFGLFYFAHVMYQEVSCTTDYFKGKITPRRHFLFRYITANSRSPFAIGIPASVRGWQTKDRANENAHLSSEQSRNPPRISIRLQCCGSAVLRCTCVPIGSILCCHPTGIPIAVGSARRLQSRHIRIFVHCQSVIQ